MVACFQWNIMRNVTKIVKQLTKCQTIKKCARPVLFSGNMPSDHEDCI